MSDEFPRFPATLEFLVLSLKTQTELHLGLYGGSSGDDKEEKSGPELGIARHSIDLLAMLQEKTRGNCTVEEERLLNNALTELRFRFVQATEQQQRMQQQKEEASKSENQPEPPPSAEGQATS